MFNYFFNIGLIYVFIGLLVSLVFYFVMKKKILGKFWVALLICVFGSFIGGLLGYFLEPVIEYLSNINESVNVFPPLITSFILIWIYSRISEKL